MALGAIDLPDKACRKAETRFEEDAPVVGQSALPVDEMDLRLHENRSGMTVEGDEGRGQPVELPRMNAVVGQSGLERLAVIEPTHDHQPIDDFSLLPTDRQSPRGPHQRHDILIDVGCQSAVQSKLGATRRFALRQGREVQIGEPDGLFQLEDALAGEKHPRHVGLAAHDLAHRKRIRRRTAEKSYLIAGQDRIGWRAGVSRRINCTVVWAERGERRPQPAAPHQALSRLIWAPCN